MRMFFGKDTTKNFMENLNNFENRELKKLTITKFLLTGTLRMGTVIKKTSMPFKNVTDSNNTSKNKNPNKV